MATNYTLKDVREAIERLWPEQDAQTWDRVGLICGDNNARVNKILLAVDAVRDTVDEAILVGADMIFTHHPLMLKGVHSIAEDTYKGSLLADLIRNNCALLAAHTNADVPTGGVSDVLANALGLVETEPIEEGNSLGSGIGRVGRLQTVVTLAELAERLTKILPSTAVGARVAGNRDQEILNVAVLGGSGDSLLSHPKVKAADVYITSDLRHHPAQEAIEQNRVTGGPALIDVPHWASESLWLEDAAKELENELPGIKTVISQINTDPWTFRVG